MTTPWTLQNDTKLTQAVPTCCPKFIIVFIQHSFWPALFIHQYTPKAVYSIAGPRCKAKSKSTLVLMNNVWISKLWHYWRFDNGHWPWHTWDYTTRTCLFLKKILYWSWTCLGVTQMGSVLNVTRCTFIENSASFGGAIYALVRATNHSPYNSCKDIANILMLFSYENLQETYYCPWANITNCLETHPAFFTASSEFVVGMNKLDFHFHFVK